MVTVAERRLEAAMEDLLPTRYAVKSSGVRQTWGDEVIVLYDMHIELRDWDVAGRPRKYAVVYRGMVLSKTGEFIRDVNTDNDNYLSLCRYDTIEEAHAAAVRKREKMKEEGQLR